MSDIKSLIETMVFVILSLIPSLAMADAIQDAKTLLANRARLCGNCQYKGCQTARRIFGMIEMQKSTRRYMLSRPCCCEALHSERICQMRPGVQIDEAVTAIRQQVGTRT